MTATDRATGPLARGGRGRGVPGRFPAAVPGPGRGDSDGSPAAVADPDRDGSPVAVADSDRDGSPAAVADSDGSPVAVADSDRDVPVPLRGDDPRRDVPGPLAGAVPDPHRSAPVPLKEPAMSEMITADLVDLDLSADTKEAAARALAERMVALGRVTDLDAFLADVAAREAQMPTGLDGGIGIPHCRSAHVTEPTLAFGRSAAGIDFGAADGPADLIFLIAAPAGADDAHLTILSSLARQLMNAEFTDALRSAGDAAAAAALIRGEEPDGTEDSVAVPAAASAGPAT
ncbi:PTS sugar transporter subunit IIA, partial [Streptomyces sp. NPDC057336]|uniref:PTS sugar transporter subunit IIA n=1 Tax=Streptomyces sp. NPDC057336 TaxID=3346102 RepID=UPI0036384E2E